MKILKPLYFVSVLWFLCRAAAADPSVIISEFMASNTSGLKDEDGDYSDWIELHNPGSKPVSLENWFLTTSSKKLTQWRFPATNLPPQGFLVVFASGKDRRVAGTNLHTNFKLPSSGSYLALVQPDGLTVASGFSPTYPAQAQDVSYGYGIQTTSLTLVGTNVPLQYLVPKDGTLGDSWLQTGFADAGWKQGTNAIGYEVLAVDPSEDVYASVVDASKPALWYRLNESSGSVATNSGSLGNAFTGTNVNATVGVVGPRPPSFGGFETNNRALRFNGTTSRVRIPDVSALHRGAAPFSVELWFSPVVLTRGDLFTWKGSDGEFGIRLGAQNTGVVSVYHNQYVGSAGGIVANKFQHIAVSRDDSGLLTVYLNGVPMSASADSAPFGWAADLLLGANHNGNPATPSFVFNGTLDEVAVYDRALTFEEVSQHFVVGSTGPASFTNAIVTSLTEDLYGKNGSVYLRLPFNVESVSAIDRMTLRMRYDDGFVAWINGQEVAMQNAPDSLAWNSNADRTHPDKSALTFEEFEVADFSEFLKPGFNVLAIQGLNVAPDNSDFLIQAELSATDAGAIGTQARYFRVPTPGDYNGVGSTDLGPIISSVDFTPALPDRPLDTDSITVTAKVAPSFQPLGDVILKYRVQFGVTNSLPMLDDGQHGDGAAGDGIFGAVIPEAASTNGQLVRFYVQAIDSQSHTSRWPLFEDPKGSPEYLGTVIANKTNVVSLVPMWEWFAKDVGAATSDGGTRGDVFFRGQLYDNIRIRRRGAATTNGQKFDFLHGHRPYFDELGNELDEVNINNQASDPSYIRPPLAWETFRTAGNSACISFNMLLRKNGTPDRVGIFVEQVDALFLKRNGLDQDGALYKFVQRSSGDPIFTDPTDGVEKKLPTPSGPHDDLAALCAGLSLKNTADQRYQFIIDNVNLPALLTHLACRSIIMDSDDVRKNIYMFRDTFGSGEWTIFPWDKDWSFGIEGDGGEFLHHPFFGDQPHRKTGSDQWSLLYHDIFQEPRLAELYLRRLRTVMDQQLQAPGIPSLQNYFAKRADAWFALVARNLSASEAAEVTSIKNNFLPNRRLDLYSKYSITNARAAAIDRLVPLAQPANVLVSIGRIEAIPASGNPLEEYVQLTNQTSIAVDISGWRLDGAIQHTFRAGTVMRPNNVFYVSPRVSAFRARKQSPKGGEGAFAQGDYQGELSARGETVRLYDDLGRLRDTKSYEGDVSPAQSYLRISEIMYHPAPIGLPDGSEEDFEFIELVNVSSDVTLDLTGVRFTKGIDFTFPAGAGSSLAPGARLVLVRNLNSFQARYGNQATVGGVYTGFLDNQGETLRLEDARGEKILEFAYNNSWAPTTDGLGFSLVINDASVDWSLWDKANQWRPSGSQNGSPGRSDSAAAIPAVVVNEVLSNPKTGDTDQIELFNPTSKPADVSGWYLTDDASSPKKYRIPTGRTIPAGGFLVFKEADFNGNTAASKFALGAGGDQVYLFSANSAGDLTGYAHGVAFGPSFQGEAFARYLNSQGIEQWTAESATSFGETNHTPRIGPVILTEVMYHPIDDLDGSDNSIDEYLVFENVSASSISLGDSWRLRGVVDYDFPPGTDLAPGEKLVLTNFSPTDTVQSNAFHNLYGLANTVRLLGPYSSKLNNHSGEIRLERGEPLVSGEVVYPVVEQLNYSDQLPWPVAADGSGAALRRIQSSAFGNDVANWTAGTPGFGSATEPAQPIVITSAPKDVTVDGGATAVFSVSASSASPLRYQWWYESRAIPTATNTTLAISGVTVENAGRYSVVILSPNNVAFTGEARLNVRVRPVIMTPPFDRSVLAGTNVSLSVGAVGTGPLHYQWRQNGADIPGANSPTLAFSNVQPDASGDYTVLVQDDVGSVVSSPAKLVVSVRPTILVQPQTVYVVQGDDAVLSVVTEGTFPLSYRWQRKGVNLTNQILNAHSSLLVITNVQQSMTGIVYQVIITNLGGGTALTSTQATLQLLADTDGDRVPDQWEVAHQFNPNDASDGSLDADGDGVSNRDEYLSGTDPRDPKSFLRIQGIAGLSAGKQLQFLAVSNQTYSLVARDGVTGTAWKKIADVPALSTNRLETFLDSSSGTSNRFYRLTSPAIP